MKHLSLLTFGLFAVLSITKVHAQSAAQLQAQLGSQQKRMWGMTLTNTISTTVLEPSDYRANTNNTFTGVYRYNFGKFNFRALLSGNKDLTGAREDRFTTAFLEVSKRVGFLSNKNVITIFQGRLTPAVNDERRYNESHRGAYSAGLLYIIDPGHPNFQVVAITRVTKNIHEFEINRAGSYNNSVSAMTYAAVSFFPPKTKWELGVNATVLQGWDYQGAAGESSTFLGQSIGYNYSNNLIITAGHEMGGRTFGYSQESLDLSVFDSDKSTLYASLTFNY